MSRILVGITSLSVDASMDNGTRATIEIVVKDHPANMANHLRLLGMLGTFVLSDDDGEFTVSVSPSAKKE